MFVVFAESTQMHHATAVTQLASRLGFAAHPIRHQGRAGLAVVPKTGDAQAQAADQVPKRMPAAALQTALAAMEGVAEVCLTKAPYVLVGREAHTHASLIDVQGVQVGGNAVVVMAGPCAVESREQLFACAGAARQGGATFLRGGAFKPRTSPYEFQGLGAAGLRLLQEAGRAFDLRVITEVVCPADVALVAEHAHVLQIGARNMQNFALLKAVGGQSRPVMLKRGLCATYREWLMAAEYIAAHGNPHVLLCERGIRTFESHTRNTFDVAAVPALRALTHLPILVDPSHATGRRDIVAAVAKAGVAAGADGILVEMHPNPEVALSDGPQSLTFADFAAMTRSLGRVAAAVDRTLSAGDLYATPAA